jgi:tetratricopeptide (TPR) repeat protein
LLHGIPDDSSDESLAFYKALEVRQGEVNCSGGPRVVVLLTIPQLRSISRLAKPVFDDKRAFVAWPVQEIAQGTGSSTSTDEELDSATQTFTGGSRTSVSREDAEKVVKKLREQASTMADTPARAQIILKIALIQSAQGMLEEARVTGTQAARIFKKLNDMQGMAQCYEVMGSLAERRGNFRIAKDWMRYACEAWRGVGSEIRTAEVNAKLGHLCYVTGDHENAAVHFQEAISIDEALGNDMKVSAGLRRLGMLALDQEQFDVSEKLFLDAKDICKRLGDNVGLSRCTHQLGHLFERMGRFDDALEWHAQSYEVKTNLGDRLGMATSRHHMGNTHLMKKDYDEAIRCYQEALEIEEDEGDKQGMANTLLQMGEVANDQHRYEDAVFFFAAARSFYEEAEAALAMILIKRVERMFDLIEERNVRAIERDVQRRMEAGERVSLMASGTGDAHAGKPTS